MTPKELAERIEALRQDLEGTGAEVILSSGRPATRIEVEAMGAIARLQDENRELREKLNQRISYGAMLIAQERERQVRGEGFTAEHDDQHPDNALAYAALCYLVPDAPSTVMSWWPWDMKWWKPKDRVSNLVRAGALIAAELDRLRRLGEVKEGEAGNG